MTRSCIGLPCLLATAFGLVSSLLLLSGYIIPNLQLPSSFEPLLAIQQLVSRPYILAGATFSNGATTQSGAESSHKGRNASSAPPTSCDLFQGKWVPHSNPIGSGGSNGTSLTPKPSASCPFRNDNWKCEHKPYHPSQALVWKPDGCSLCPLEDTSALALLRNKRIGCIGDSLCQNFHESIICNLLDHDPELDAIADGISHRAFHSNRFNLTVMACFSEYLVKKDSSESAFEELGIDRTDWSHFLVHVDVIDPVVARCLKAMDVVVISTGQWWLGKPKVYMLGGSPVELTLESALAGGLRTLTNHVLTSNYSGLAIFRTITPSHFVGGTWQTAGKCAQTQALSTAKIAEVEKEIGGSLTLQILQIQRQILGGGDAFKMMDIYPLSVARADGHPGNDTSHGGWDCVHWCEPGVLDTWTQLLYAMVEEHFS